MFRFKLYEQNNEAQDKRKESRIMVERKQDISF